VRLRASLSPPSAPAIPGGFDFQRQAFFQGVGAVGFALGRARITAPAGDDGVFSLANWIGRQRVDLGRRVMAALLGTAGAMAAALITGERRAIPPGVIDAMRDSGLAHLLAISGLHIGLVAGLLFGAVRLAVALVPALVTWGVYFRYFSLGVDHFITVGTLIIVAAFIVWGAIGKSKLS